MKPLDAAFPPVVGARPYLEGDPRHAMFSEDSENGGQRDVDLVVALARTIADNPYQSSPIISERPTEDPRNASEFLHQSPECLIV